MSEHIIDEVCECEYCIMLDVMFGDPNMTKWERAFHKSMCEWGWRSEYTEKQKAKIKQTFNRLKNLRIPNERN